MIHHYKHLFYGYQISITDTHHQVSYTTFIPPLTMTSHYQSSSIIANRDWSSTIICHSRLWFAIINHGGSIQTTPVGRGISNHHLPLHFLIKWSVLSSTLPLWTIIDRHWPFSSMTNNHQVSLTIIRRSSAVLAADSRHWPSSTVVIHYPSPSTINHTTSHG